MKPVLLFVFLLLFSLNSLEGFAQAQDIGLIDNSPLEGVLKEGLFLEEGNEGLILDNTRTKVGRDFYEIFYTKWAENPIGIPTESPGDTTFTNQKKPEIFNENELLVTIEELPTPNVGTTLIAISINDQLLWQQFLQARLDVIEALAQNAVEAVRQYMASYQEIQAQMGSEDQVGSGIF